MMPGRELFFDKPLSADNTLSCAGCHMMDKAGTDNARFASGVCDRFGDVNAPTVCKATFHFSRFWDGRDRDLQEQAGGLHLSSIGLGCRDWDEMGARLAQDEEST